MATGHGGFTGHLTGYGVLASLTQYKVVERAGVCKYL